MFVNIPIEVQGANALCGSTAVGYPGMPAFLGFANAFRRSLDPSWGCNKVSSIAVVHHRGRTRTVGRYKDRLTHKRAVHDSSDRPSRSFFSTPIEVQPQIDLSCTVVIEIDLPEATVEEAGHEAARKNRTSPLDAAVPVRAFGGRSILEGAVTAFLDQEDALRRAKPGWILADRTREVVDPLRSPMDALFWRCRRRSHDGSNPDDDEIGRVPMHVGYAGIGPGARREGSRDPETDHFFAEPITGLAMFTPRHEAMADGCGSAFWVPSIDRERRLFTIRARQ